MGVCNFCLTEKDSVFHYLWQCPHTKDFWTLFLDLLKRNCQNCHRLALCPELILFGTRDNTKTDKGFDFILVRAKFFIYKCRLNKTKPNVNVFIKDLKYHYNIDEYVHKLEMKLEEFRRKWAAYETIFED